MQLYHNLQVNRTTYLKGTQFKVIGQQFDTTFNQEGFLFEATTGEHKGNRFFSCDLRAFKEYKTPVNEFLFFIGEYISAGWTEEKIITAGLAPAECKPYLKQFIKYWDKLKIAPSI